MKKLTKLSIQWFYDLLEKGECALVDFKEQLEDKVSFGKSLKSFSSSYEELARDVVAFANYKGGFLFIGIIDSSKEVNKDFHYSDAKVFELIKQIQDRTEPTITLQPHKINVDGTNLLLLEIPFSEQLHRTSKGEFLIIEIRKYPSYIEFESPGGFPQGVDTTNYLRKTNARNPNIMDVLREIGFTEKAGSGFDKVFQALLSKGKDVPIPEETNHSLIFRVKAEITSEQLMQLAHQYATQTGTKMDMDYLLVMNQILITKGCSFNHLENAPYISKLRLKHILANLTENEFIETSGKTSGQKYILHVSKRKTTKEKINYSLKKRQTKARQKEAILRYLDSVGKINNPEARELLKLEPKDVSHVSRLFKELLESEDIVILSEKSKNQRVYGRKK